MFIAELFNGAPKHVAQPEQTYVEDSGPQLVVLYPGRFQPFHLGHRDVFNALQSKFGRGNVFISTSNKTEEGRSPFNYSDKLVFMTAAGVPVDCVIENTSPYKLPPNFDPANTILVVAVGAPDADRLRPGSYKKDGQPGYYQKFESVEKCTTSDKHGYVLIAAERKKTITIGGKQYDASHGTEVRNLWNAIRNKPQQRAEFITQMFGRNDPEVGRVLDKIDLAEAAGEVALPVDSISPIHGGLNESFDDMFAPTKAQQVAQGLLAYAAELKSDIAAQHPTWHDSDFGKMDNAKLGFVLNLVGYFKVASKVPAALNYIARVLNGDSSVVEYYKRHAIWDADDFLKEKIGFGFAELFKDYEKYLDENAEDDMFAGPRYKDRIISLLSDADAYQQDNDTYSAIECLEEADVLQQKLTPEQNNKVEAVHDEIQYIIGELDEGAADVFATHNRIENIIEHFTEETLDENEEDMFAKSVRVSNQVERDRHPLSEYLTFEDYDHLMDEFADMQSAVKEDYEMDAYLEKFESGLKSAAIPQEIVEIIEEFVHGRHGKYGTEVPRRNQVLLADLNNAFSRIWMDYKPDRFVHTLMRHMSLACVAAIHARDPYPDNNEFYESDDDLFADSERIKRGRQIAQWIESNSQRMIHEPVDFIYGRGWNERSEFDNDLDLMIEETQEAGADMLQVAKTFKANGVDAGINHLKSVYQESSNQPLEWVVDEILDDIENDFGVEINESDDDMFASGGKLAQAAKRNMTGKIAARGRAGRKTDQELQTIVTIAKSVYGNPYSTGTIGGGKIYRLSFPTLWNYRQVPLSSVTPDDKKTLDNLKQQFINALTHRGLDVSRVDIKYHIGSGLYTSVRIKMKDTE